RSIVNGVPFHTHHFRFNESGAFAMASALAGLMRGIIDLTGIGSIHDHAGHAISNRTFGKVLDAKLHIGRCGITPEIVFHEQHESQLLDSSKVEAFVGNAGGLAAVADVSHYGNVLALEPGPEGDPSQYRDQIA